MEETFGREGGGWYPPEKGVKPGAAGFGALGGLAQ